MPMQQLFGQATLDLGEAVLAARGACDGTLGDIGTDDLDIPAGELCKAIHQQQREAIGLLPGGAGRAPDP